MKPHKHLSKLVGLAILCTTLSAHAAPTEITISDDVLVANTKRIGINLTGDNYFSGSVLTKMRITENFEGALLRQCHFGPISSEEGVASYFGDKYGDWDEILIGGNLILLSGPQQWERRKIVKIEGRPYEQKGTTKQARFFVVDKPITPLESKGGFMVIGDNPNLGNMRGYHKFWNTEKNNLVFGDVRPDGFGVAALRLAGSEMPSHYRFTSHDQRHAETNGTWKIRFWAKALAETEATLQLKGESIQKAGLNVNTTVEVPTQWTQFEEEIILKNIPEPDSPEDIVRVGFIFKADGQDILIDDIEIWMEGHTNPTAFTDDTVAALKKFNPGLLRIIQMGGSTIDNLTSPRLKMRSYGSQPQTKDSPSGPIKNYSYTLGEFYGLCEEIDAEPWYCLPGTILPEELEQFLEYVAGDVSTPYGKRRLNDDHPKPWTDTLKQIHIEFGNEAWNSAPDYQCGGFNGPDYWNDLIARAKASSNYRDNIVFHAAGQASYSDRNRRIMANTPNADFMAVGPYIINTINKKDMEAWETDEDYFRWAFAWPIDRSLTPGRVMVENYEYAQQAGKELSIYEVNHHITHGDAPSEPRNKLVTSLAGGLNLCNDNLLMLREQGIRQQCLYNLIQLRYKAKTGYVRLWGTTLNMRKGHERYRPTSLALRMVNQVIEGDLITTSHSDNQPTFTATGRFGSDKENSEFTTNTLWSYAFKNDKQRGVVLINLDTSNSQQTEIKFAEKVQGSTATAHLLTGDSLTANNEYEVGDPQVKITESALKNFKSGAPVTLPPHSMIVLKWAVQ